MKKHLAILFLVLATTTSAISQQERRWEILVSAVSLEQQDGLFFTGAVKGEYLNAIAISAPVAKSNYVRIFARRIDWNTATNGFETAERSEQKGYSVGIGYEHRWLPGAKLSIGVGSDISFQKSDFTGVFFSDSDPFEFKIDHTKYVYGIAPFLSFNYQINKWLMVRLETAASIGVAKVVGHTDVTISPVDVYFDATLRPVSILGLAVRL